MKHVDPAHIGFLLGSEVGREHLKEMLYDPRFVLWSSTPQDLFSTAFEPIRSPLFAIPRLAKLLEIHVVSECLLYKAEAPAWFPAWVDNNAKLKNHLPDLDWESALKGQWSAVPVILVHGNGYLRYFVVGLVPDSQELPLWPEWANELMNENTREAIRSAAAAAAGSHPVKPNGQLHCYPLAAPNGSIQFEGASLGLPLALGFKKLLAGAKGYAALAATGSIEEKGSILKVSHLTQKVKHAGKKGFKVFLYPAENHTPEVPEGMEILPVAHLEEAWMFSSLYEPGRGMDLILMAKMLEDPGIFVDNCATVPWEWIAWAGRHGKTSSLLKGMLDSRELFEAFVNRFEKWVNGYEISRAEAAAMLIDPQEIRRAWQIAPLAVFRWYTLNLALSNHRGKLEAAAGYARLADPLVEGARKTSLDTCADYHNHRFVSLHNRYDFSPTLPEGVKKTLRGLEKRYAIQCQSGCRTDETLGRLYGSISQNYGFCGPAFFEETRRYALLSQKAFGEGTVPECKKDWLRQLNYLAYAQLDTRGFAQAEQSLLAYLEIETWDGLQDLLPRLSQWQHALLARFFADTLQAEKSKKYFTWAVDNKDRLVKREHPWQLWVFNLARLAENVLKDEDRAARLYCESVDLCLSADNGRAVHVMALLPLAGLWKLARLAFLEMEKIEKALREAAENVNRRYFKTLLDEKDLKRVLEHVWAQPDLLFPYTYR